MNTDVINLKNATALGQNPSASVGKKDLGKEDFLRLLMTQLSAQDPLNPSDSTEFLAQLSQFSSLEGITNIGTKMDKLISVTNANSSSSAVSLLGREVRVAGNAIGGNGKVAYQLDTNAQNAQLVVRDERGGVVKVIDDIGKSKGTHMVDLTDLQPGKYSFTVEAQDILGEDIKASLSHYEKVTGVNFSSGVPVLMSGYGQEITPSDVIEIRVAEVPHG